MSIPSTASSAPVKLITALHVSAAKKELFFEWNARASNALLSMPGFTSRELIPPQTDDVTEWVLINRFDSIEHLHDWRASDARKRLAEELQPLLDGEPTELVGDAAAQYQMENSVTEVILDQIAPGKEAAYQDWSNRIQKAQAESTGYKGGYSQRLPKDNGVGWMTLMRFASIEDLNRWMSSPVRQALIEESKDLVAVSYQHRVDASFPGWVPTDASGKTPPNWKTTMLVLLGLYPIVCIEILFLMKKLSELGIPSALAGFIGNAISVTLVAYITMPALCRWLDWWLFPKTEAPNSVHWKGALIVLAFYALSVALFWKWM